MDPTFFDGNLIGAIVPPLVSNGSERSLAVPPRYAGEAEVGFTCGRKFSCPGLYKPRQEIKKKKKEKKEFNQQLTYETER